MGRDNPHLMPIWAIWANGTSMGGINMFHIFTQDKNRHTVHTILGKYLKGYSLWETEGMFEGKMEQSLVIAVYGGKDTYQSAIKPACQEICEVNDQKQVDVINLRSGQINSITRKEQ